MAKQGVSFKLADMAMQIEASRLLVWRAAAALETGGEAGLLGSYAKAFAADTAMSVDDGCRADPRRGRHHARSSGREVAARREGAADRRGNVGDPAPRDRPASPSLDCPLASRRSFRARGRCTAPDDAHPHSVAHRFRPAHGRARGARRVRVRRLRGAARRGRPGCGRRRRRPDEPRGAARCSRPAPSRSSGCRSSSRSAQEQFPIKASSLGVEADWQAALRTAASEGEGFGPVRGFKRLQTRFFGAEVSPPVQAYTSALEYKLGQIADEIDRAHVEAKLVRRGLAVRRRSRARTGCKLDREAAADAVVRALATVRAGRAGAAARDRRPGRGHGGGARAGRPPSPTAPSRLPSG